MYVAIFITIIMILLGFIFRQSRILFALQGIWLWILTGFNSGGVDFAINQDLFMNSQLNLSVGEGLTVLYDFFKNRGMNFITYNVITTLIAYILIFYIINKNSKNKCIVASLLYFYPAVDFVVQKRFFLAMALLLVAVQYLGKEDKKSRIKYIFLVLLSALCHVSALLYFVPFVFQFVQKKYRNKLIIILSLIGIVISKYLGKILSFLPFVSSTKIQLYFVDLSANSNMFKFMFWCFWQLAFWVILYYLNVYLKREQSDHDVIQKTYNLNIDFMCILPFYAFDPVFVRLFRPVVIFDYIAVSAMLQNGKRQYKIVLKAILLMVALSVCSFVIFYIITGVGFEQMVLGTFKNNIILSNLF